MNITSHNVEQTVQFGIQLGRLLHGGDVVCLSGDLGAGKTALTSGIGKGWGALELVNSPTFVFVHEHRRGADDVRLYHLDCYRLSSEGDSLSVGVDDILAGQDVVVIEWPERIASILPAERLWIQLDELDDPALRSLTLEATGPRYMALLDELRSN